MSTIKRSSAPKTTAPRKAPAKPVTPAASKPAEAGKPSEATKPSSEVSRVDKPAESKKPEDLKKPLGVDKPEGSDKPETKPGETAETAETTKPQELDENGKPIETEDGKPADDKDPKDTFEESAELQAEKDENAEMREELQGLKDALASLYGMMDSDEEKTEAAKESPGMCCGRPKSTQKASDGEGNKDWNAILTMGIAAVKAQGLGQGNLSMLPGGQGQQQGQGQAGTSAGAIGQAKPGQAGGPKAAAKNGAAGSGQQTDPRIKLASDYEKAKSAKAELKPEVENEVRSLLGMPPLEGQQGPGAQGQGGQGQSKPNSFGQGFQMASGF